MKIPCILVTFRLASLAYSAEPNKATSLPDFTVNTKLPDGAKHDWTLGPSGARGWYYTANGHSHAARQILVTGIAAGSPADGILLKNDVILGVNDINFTDDARVQFANAVTAAESTSGTLLTARPRRTIAQSPNVFSNSAAPRSPNGWHRRITFRSLKKRQNGPRTSRRMATSPGITAMS